LKEQTNVITQVKTAAAEPVEGVMSNDSLKQKIQQLFLKWL
jgi:hypothetical protein